MSSHEMKIIEFLGTMGYAAQLKTDGGGVDLKFTSLTHMGVNMLVVKDREFFVWVQAGLGWVPKQNVAPLFRRLLELQNVMGGPYFTVDANNWLSLMLCRQLDGLEFVEFRWLLDTLASNYWQRVATVIQEFQVPQQPT